MNRAVILQALLLASSQPLGAQEGADFGISEKIGNQVPLDLTFTDEWGKKVSLKEIIDRPVVLSLVYFKCLGICTPVLDGMVYTLERVNAQPGEDFIAITVSFDPGEGAELARQKKKNYLDSIERPFPSDAWRWLTADKETIEKLTTAVGFEYKKEGVEFRHAANLIYGLFKGKKVGANPWEGITLEWTIPSPPPLENFEKIPHVTRGPYDYKVEESK